jgi:DNA-binding SARP family transcriptional activator
VLVVELEAAARVSLLDGFTLTLGDRRHGRPEELPRAAQRLVAHLSLGARVTRNAVAGQLWPNVLECHAHGSLRSTLWRVHKLVPGLIRASGDTLSLADGVQVDVRELTAWAQRVSDRRTCIDETPSTAAELRGELLPGWFEDWVLLERERVRQMRMHAFETMAERLTDAGRYGEAVEVAYAAVRAEPLRESAHRTLVRVHLAEGNLVEALRAYEAYRGMLADELGVVPTRQMVDLVCRLPEQRPPAPALAVEDSSSDRPWGLDALVVARPQRLPSGPTNAVPAVTIR